MNQFLVFVRGRKATVNVHIFELFTNGEVAYIWQYAVVIELTEKKSRLVSLYRGLSGQWLDNYSNADEEMINELKREIELLDGSVDYSSFLNYM